MNMKDKLLNDFIKLVSIRTGLCMREQDYETFRKKILAQVKSCSFSEPEEYYELLERDTPESRTEWKKIIALTTTGESYFFRDQGHFFLLQNTILPELIKNKETQRSLRIWSAGCSTGEEPYSVAILLDMLLPDLKGRDIFIIGTDINEESLKKAERGIYSQWSFRMVDKNIQSQYFNRHKDEWEIDGRIKKMVKFQYGNLIEDGFFSQNPEICNMDIILCRNVFIYFKSEAVSSVFNIFLKTLNDEGYLITGHAELHGHDLTRLRQIMFPEAVIYKKTSEYGMRNMASNILDFGSRILDLQSNSKDQIPKLKDSKSKIERRVPDLKHPEKRERLEIDLNKQSKIQNPKLHIEELIKKGQKDNHDMLYLMAQAYANSGNYEKAESACRKAMNINADSAEPYFLLAHIAEAKGNNEKAKDFFKKVIYLEPAFIAAYIELGGLYEKENNHPRAKKSRTTAIELLKSLPSQTHVKPYDITAGELLKYVKDLTGSGDDNLILSGSEGKSRR